MVVEKRGICCYALTYDFQIAIEKDFAQEEHSLVWLFLLIT